jgi:hypothetical protein
VRAANTVGGMAFEMDTTATVLGHGRNAILD